MKYKVLKAFRAAVDGNVYGVQHEVGDLADIREDLIGGLLDEGFIEPSKKQSGKTAADAVDQTTETKPE